MDQCEAIIKTGSSAGNRCKRKIKDKKLCALHLRYAPKTTEESTEVNAFPKDCPLCDTQIEQSQNLSCEHEVHRQCLITDSRENCRYVALCPICKHKHYDVYSLFTDSSSHNSNTQHTPQNPYFSSNTQFHTQPNLLHDFLGLLMIGDLIPQSSSRLFTPPSPQNNRTPNPHSNTSIPQNSFPHFFSFNPY